MYNLAKLLTDEPHKLERLIILLLKLLITFHVTGLLFGYDLSVGSIIDNPIPKSASAIQIIYFFVVLVAVWFVLWSILADFVLYHFVIGMLARIGKDKTVFMHTMSFIGVVGEKAGILTPKSNIISFVEGLSDSEHRSELMETQSRIKEYYLLTVVAYTVLLISASGLALSRAEIIIGGILVANQMIGCIVLTKFNAYVGENMDSIQRDFQPLAYGQKIMNALAEIKRFECFESPHKGKKIVLKRKPGYENLPDTLKILPAFHWNEPLGQDMLLRMVQARKRKELSGTSYDLILTNIKPTSEISSGIRSQENCAYIYAKDEQEIFSGLEHWIHLFAPTKYPIKLKTQNENQPSTVA